MLCLQSSTRDPNHDGKVDELNINIAMPLNSDEAITSATALVYVDVGLSVVTRMKMDAALVVHYASATPGTSLTADGDVVFRQRDSLPFAPGGTFTPYLLDALVYPSTAVSMGQVLPSGVIAATRARNYTVELDVPHPSWTVDVGFAPATPGSTDDLSNVSQFDTHAGYTRNSARALTRRIAHGMH